MCSGSVTDPASSYRPACDTGATVAGRSAVPASDAVYEGAAGLRAYREASHEMHAVSARDDPRSFRAHCRVYHLGAAVLTDVRSSSLRYSRAARHIAHCAYDHYQVTFNLSGEIHCRSARQSAIVRPGDIVVLDTTRETEATVDAPDRGSARALTLFVPRPALAALQRAPAGGHLLLLSGERRLTRSLHDHLSQVLTAIEVGAQAELHAAAQRLVGLLADSLGGRREPPGLALGQEKRGSTLDSLERLIERRLNSPTLSLGLLCSHCGCSRATLYRLFDAEGGPIRYIRQRRLERALRELISGSASDRPILQLALRHRFASEATFNRAFRRTFGIPPGELRDIAARSRRAAVLHADGDGAQAINWIRTLGQGAERGAGDGSRAGP